MDAMKAARTTGAIEVQFTGFLLNIGFVPGREPKCPLASTP